jgi:branched-chain amino acid transport system substrate-binding protein
MPLAVNIYDCLRGECQRRERKKFEIYVFGGECLVKIKKSSKVLVILTLLVFTASMVLTGCSSKSSSTASGEKVIKIGLIAPLTGDVKTFGESVKNGAELAVSERNSKVGNFKIQLVIQDDRNLSSEAANVATKLMTEDKVSAIIGSVTSKCTIPVSEVAQQYKVVVITPTSTSTKVTVDNGKRKDYAFRACFIDPFQGTVAAKFALDNLKVKTAAMMYDQGNDYTVGLSQNFKKNFEAGGGKVVDSESYTTQDTDFSAQLTKIANLKPDLLYLPDYYQKVGLIAKQARDKGITAKLMGGDGWDSTKIDWSAVDGGYFTNHYSVDDPRPEVQNWVKKYQQKYGSKPDSFATLTYEAAQMLFKAIEATNSGDSTKLKDYIANMKDFQGVTAKITIDKDGNPVKAAAIIQIKDKKQVFVTSVAP